MSTPWISIQVPPDLQPMETKIFSPVLLTDHNFSPFGTYENCAQFNHRTAPGPVLCTRSLQEKHTLLEIYGNLILKPSPPDTLSTLCKTQFNICAEKRCSPRLALTKPIIKIPLEFTDILKTACSSLIECPLVSRMTSRRFIETSMKLSGT